MLRVGLTGGVACGKSTDRRDAGRAWRALPAGRHAGAPALRAGRSPTYDAVVERFGREILNCNGSIDRKRLANAAFPDRIGELNAIVHPGRGERAESLDGRECAQSDPDGIAVVEAALILEAGAAKDFDKLIVVTCDSRTESCALRAARQVLRRKSAAPRSCAAAPRSFPTARRRHAPTS